MILGLKNFLVFRHGSLLILTMAMATKGCFSFVATSRLLNKSQVPKKSKTDQRSFSVYRNRDFDCTQLFSSSLLSTSFGASASRSTSFSIHKRVISQEESEKQQQLIGASKLQLAPMMEYTDRHFRHLIRLISGKTLLYTEMVAANALSHERAARIQEYQVANKDSSVEDVRKNYSDQYLQRYLNQGRIEPFEGPSVLQLGGSDPAQLYEAAQTVMDMVRFDTSLVFLRIVVIAMLQ